MIIHIKQFGKIKSADINLGDLTLFIGENNSGKTYLMQLIYRILYHLTNFRNINDYIDGEKAISCINSSNWQQINDAVNKYLWENKEKIAEETFLNSFSIGEISVELNNLDGEYLLINKDQRTQRVDINPEKEDYFEITYNGKLRIGCLFGRILSDAEKNDFFVREVLCQTIDKRNVFVKSLFIPASRAGLMLVYRNVIASQSRIHSIANLSENREPNRLGLTRPVYEFLEFLQTYNFSSTNDQKKRIVDFISNNIIDGTFDISNNTILYKPNSSNEYFPAHLSSSMVNEIAPVVMMLTNSDEYNFIFYDEIETCLHPLKQIEMARLTARIVNNGYKMIISTHSDTMAIALNNLIMLSQMKDRKTKADKLGYSEDDFFKSDNIHVYQFKCDNGETIVSEIEMYPNINVGYDFELFNKSNDKLYTDAKTIMGDSDE